jgi:molybdate transport system substrate-binding protein
MSRRALVVLVVLVALAAAPSCGAAAGGEAEPAGASITVAAASDLRLAFEELGSRFTDETGTAVTFSFGSSGQLREQILNGAPFDVYASADIAYVDAVIEGGRGVAATKADYGLGRIVLWSRGGAPPASVEDLVDVDGRIAVANPEHAPYGRAAIEVLDATGVGDQVQDRIVYGENISDTLRIAESGNAEVGIVALSLVITTGAPYVLVPEELHRPIRQALVVTAPEERLGPATAFARYVNSVAGRQVMLRYGFALPGEDLALG